MQHPDTESNELFRRAILVHDEDAWATIHRRFGPLLASWVWRSGACAHSAECNDIADQAFARAWAALKPEHVANSSTLAQLLSYLRTCVMTAIIDQLRQQSAREIALSDAHVDTAATPEQIVLVELDRAALWHTALAVTTNMAEQIALVESFIFNLR